MTTTLTYSPDGPRNTVDCDVAGIFDEDYFAHVYGATSVIGESSQTRIDEIRDRLLVRLAIRYAAKPIEQCSVFDVGCGYGFLLDAFEGARVRAGADISVHAIDHARRRHPERRYRRADLQEGAVFDETFDVVLAVNVLEHLHRPGAGIDSLRSQCHPGSVVLCHLPVVDHRLGAALYARTYASDPTHVWRPSGRKVRAEFEARGFATVRATYLPHVAPWLTRHLRLHPSFLAVFRLPA
jgi:2-polyprenyl-3-methyl-5-hydroxy-6-metoxy-1,4-benzoquinol methylase